MPPRTLILFLLLLSTFGHSAPKVLVIGDSLSEEYSFEIPFSAPESDPLDANTENWIEILAAHRASQLDFGNYASSIASYSDVRNGGFSYNWSIPGADSDTWHDVATSTLFHQPGYLTSRLTMEGQFDTVNVAVIFVGGNDVRALYGSLYNNSPPTNWITTITGNLQVVINWVKNESPSLPIILCTIPDVGATPSKQAAHPDPALRQVAAVHMANLNAAISQLATTNTLLLADVAQLTSTIIQPHDFYIGATLMLKSSDPENAPHYLFCRDGFHPATAAQAIIANTLLAQINLATSSSVPELSNREIIGNLLGLNPDQIYHDWIAGFSISNTDMLADPDHDHIPNLGEFVLNLNPNTYEAPFLPSTSHISNTPHFSLSYAANPDALRLISITNEVSTNLTLWQEISPASLLDLGGGNFQILEPTATAKFYRQSYQLKD